MAADWNVYWKGKKTSTGRMYDRIAEFYRTKIIRPALDGVLEKVFDHDARLLHAGCGGGQVDENAVDKFMVTALDLSSPALDLYGVHTCGKARRVRGDIFALPFADGVFDGVYNLGVMEHFDRASIAAILGEFRRVLRPGGRIVLFWPPEYGLSVNVLKVVHAVLTAVRGKRIMLHPEEITRLSSRKQGEVLLQEAGFTDVSYSFGVRDLFTYAVVTARK